MPATPPTARAASRYAWYVLGVLFLVYVLNFIDRQIISILAEDIKRDLALKDEDLGFLYGTAFGVFYALFGIPLGRLADTWHRGRLMVLGLTLWSAMTALSGLSRSGSELALARIGVGIGEATVSPSAYSILSDWFPVRLRATALSIYSAGLYFGAGCSLFVGGTIVQAWNHMFPTGGPAGLVGWQAAFLAVGVPGLLLAVWVATLREPARGASEGLPTLDRDLAPFKGLLTDLVAIVPPLTLIGALSGGIKSLAVNLLVAAGIAAGVATMIALGEPWPQWTAVGIGTYAIFSWANVLRRNDAPMFALIFGTPAFLCTVLAYGMNAFMAYTASFWAAPYALRVLGASPATAGLYIGVTGAIAGFLGVTLGGIAADRLQSVNPGGRLLMVVFGALAPAPFFALAFSASSTGLLYPMLFMAQFTASSALAAAATATQDMVLPRMRGTATAIFFVGATLLGLSLGPYLAGRMSTMTGSLSDGLLSLLAVVPIGLTAAVFAYRLGPDAVNTRVARARSAGEPIGA